VVKLKVSKTKLLKDKSILKLIKEQIDNLVFMDRIPDRNSSDNNKNEEISKKIGIKIVNAKIVNEVMGDIVFDELLEKTKHDDPGVVGLKKFSNIPGMDSSLIAKSVLSQLYELPKKYSFIFRLPTSSQKFPTINLGSGINLIYIDETNINLYGYVGKIKSKSLSDIVFELHDQRPRISKGDVLLTISGKGYVGKYGTIKTSSVGDPLYIFKVIMGIYNAKGIVRGKEDVDYLQPNAGYFYNIYEVDNKKMVRVISETFEDAKFLNNLEFDVSKFVPDKLHKLLKKTETDFDLVNNSIKNLFASIKFAKGKTDKKVINKQTRVKNGAYWYYESLKTSQDHIRTINIVTGYDSLLNAKGSDDTKEYKSMMVANVISDNALVADSIALSIQKLYLLRNSIIHGELAVSSLERFNDDFEKSLNATIYTNLWYLSQFLSNRITFLNKGLVSVLNTMSKKANKK